LTVDHLPQRPLATEAGELPAALHGSAGSGTVVETHFTGKANQVVRVEVEAQRLGSKLRPVVHLYGPRRIQLAWAWPAPSQAGNARLKATLPEAGAYTVAVHDVEYAPATPGYFRLKIGDWSAVDQVFPPVVEAGKQSVKLLTYNTAAEVDIDVAP